MAFRSPNGGKKVAVMLAVLGTSVGLAWYSNIRGTRSHHGAPATYIDPAKCSACHSAIHRDYQHVGMAASFRSIANAPDLQVEAASSFTPSPDRQYEVVRRDGRLFQRRLEHDAGGREANAFELEVTHSIGSGNHARSYLHRMESGEFVQLPLTWYTQEKSWGMSPGYDNATPPDFIRIVDENCLFCHNGYTRPDGTVAEGIDCQRCHGPGSTHVDLASASKPDAASIRSAIVNPKRLSPALQTDICMQCHLETTSAELPPMLRKFDRAPLSFLPVNRSDRTSCISTILPRVVTTISSRS